MYFHRNNVTSAINKSFEMCWGQEIHFHELVLDYNYLSNLFFIYKIKALVQMSMATRRLNPKFLFSRFCFPRPIASLLLRFPDNTDPRKTRRNKHVSCSFTLWSEDANYKYKHHANTLSPTKHIKTKMCFLFSLW